LYGEPELNIFCRHQGGPDDRAALVIQIVGQSEGAAGLRDGSTLSDPTGAAEIVDAGERADEESGFMAGDGGSGAIADDNVVDGAGIGESGGIDGVACTGCAGNRCECGATRDPRGTTDK